MTFDAHASARAEHRLWVRLAYLKRQRQRHVEKQVSYGFTIAALLIIAGIAIA